MEYTSELKESCLAFAKVLLAAGAVWKDSTSYSQDDNEKIPTVFSTMIGGCKISIVCGHIYHQGEWIFHCSELGFDEIELKTKTAKEAAEKAVGFCKKKVQVLSEAFSTYGYCYFLF